jgi:hypothetical protein
MTTQPGKYDITIYQGATYDVTFTWKDESDTEVNLTGYSARLKARESIDSSSAFISLTSGSGITLGGTAGTIRVLISATDTAALTQSGVYDLELESGAGVVTRLLEGNLVLSKEVTR